MLICDSHREPLLKWSNTNLIKNFSIRVEEITSITSYIHSNTSPLENRSTAVVPPFVPSFTAVELSTT